MMRSKLCYIVLCCLMAAVLAACDKVGVLPEAGGTDSIILDLSSRTLPVSRAAAAGAELAVDHLDVLIFDEDGAKAWHERIEIGETALTASGRGSIVLGAKRSSFDANSPYWVYLVANSTAGESVFSSESFDLNALRGLMQSDPMIHLTGLDNVESAPRTFLMDGIAYLKEDGAGEPAAAGPVVLNDGNLSADTDLGVTLRRAAAKIVVRLEHGNSVTFSDPDGAGYYLRNMPYSTSVIAGVNADADQMSTGITTTGYFDWTDAAITVTAYTYAHEWVDGNLLDDEVRLVVNIPMVYDDPDDAEGAVRLEGSYFQVPVSKNKILERNNCYTVNVTVNTPGAEDPSRPELLEDVRYEVAAWDEQTINVGGNDARPTFLTLNRYDLKMRNIDDDHNSIVFTSSSDVSAAITKVYYIDKFGQQQVLDKVTGTSDDYGISTGGWNPTWTNRCTVRVTPDEGLNGKLDIYSTLPENNTIRYIEITVTNDDGNECKLTVEQYPLEYITNVQGWYSYRSDFGGTTWENPGSSTKRVSATRFNSSTQTWTYSATGYGNGHFFTSKVAEEITTGTDKGKSEISYYYYRTNFSWSFSTSEIWSDGNARMYHVRIAATSDKYTIGKPRITDGKTDPGPDNAKLVSPSFMIASQLGAVYSVSSVEMAASHCEQYVEVDTNGNVYDDWRLPTRAEVEIIMDYQYKPDAAMDEVLAGDYYFCADGGTVHNTNGNGQAATAIRCIRDAFDTPADN